MRRPTHCEARDMRTDFHDDGVRGVRADAGNICEVHTCDSEQFTSQIESRLVAGALIVASLGARRHLLRSLLGAWKFPHLELQFDIHLSNELLIKAISDEGLPQREKMLGAIVSL